MHVLRLRMAPWAEPFGFRHEVVTVLDLDDDEVATHTRLAGTAVERGEGDLADHLQAEAAALGRARGLVRAPGHGGDRGVAR